uniref:Influenza virus NS1A binding protein a n=1 Tax=Cyprinus carpio carpio TaxID=630221 RepID=A0A8C1CT54_CYPCA
MIPNGYLIFEDESFLDSTVAKMNALRKNGQFCDVRLQVCGHELMAHRAVLACCSPYLFEIFNSDLEPHGVSHVKFEDLDPEAVEILLNYAYTAQLKADKELVKEVYSAAKRLKMDRVKQICGDYLLSKMDSQSAISYRNFASCMGDWRLLGKIDSYIQEHLLDVSEQEDFLKLPRLKLEVMLEDNLTLPSNGKLYSKVIGWVQRSLWENGEPLERLMEEVQMVYYSADHKLLDGSLLDGQAEVFGTEDDHIQFVQKKPPRENVHRQLSTSSSGSLSPGSTKHSCKQDWKYIASEKTTNNTYLCLAVLNGVLCVIFLHGRSSPQASPSATPCLTKSLSFEGQPLEEEPDKLLAPMHYARSGLGIAALNDRVITAGGYNREECLRTVECYNMKTDSWSFIAPMRTPRARFQMAVLMGQLYVMGGSNGHSDELSCGETYNPSADKWTQVPELRTNRCNAAGWLHVCDRWSRVLELSKQSKDKCWDTNMQFVEGGNRCSSLSGKLFVVGGFDGSHALRCVEMYDPARNEWRMLGSMNSPRSNAGAAVLGDIIYAVGGFDGNEFLNSVEAYSPKTDEWSPCADAFTNS